MIRNMKTSRAEDLWKISGDFGYVSGNTEKTESSVWTKGKEYVVRADYEKDENGVVLQNGRFKNISSEKMSLYCLQSKFLFDGGEYEAYTQRNSWHRESNGGWQPVITAVSGETAGVRNAFGCAPFFAVWNQQTGRGIAFHIMTRLPWKYEIKHIPAGGQTTYLEISIGVNEQNFALSLDADEEIKLPEILYYEFKNKRDLDCYKIHHYMNKRYPRRELPIVYNTWMYKFEKINFENVSAQVKRAKELGIEYFVTDAAWYGQGEMWACRGDWYENMTGGYSGRMQELAGLVRQNGMRFGLWLEIESAGPDSKMLQAHREYYIEYDDHGDSLYFFDFANKEACDYMYETVGNLIETYQLGYIKFDFNQDMKLDICNNAFWDYIKGYTNLIERLRNAYPDVYFLNCAAGGQRLALENGKDFDSFWYSDNQSVYEGMDIIKNTILRMPPQILDRWTVVQSICEFDPCYGEAPNEKLISSNDATWNDVRGVHLSYLKGFLTGGPIGFSCDLNKLSESVFDSLKEFISEFKEEREFWKKTVCRILTDTESMLVLEYSDMEFEHVVVLVYTKQLTQNSITFYPKLDQSAKYSLNEECILTGRQIEDEGIAVPLEMNYEAKKITLKRLAEEV